MSARCNMFGFDQWNLVLTLVWFRKIIHILCVKTDHVKNPRLLDEGWAAHKCFHRLFMFMYLASQSSREGNFYFAKWRWPQRRAGGLFSSVCFSQSEPCLITPLTCARAQGGGNKRRASHVKVVPSRIGESPCPNLREWVTAGKAELRQAGRQAGWDGAAAVEAAILSCSNTEAIDLPASRAQLPAAPDPKQQGSEADTGRGGETLAERKPCMGTI